MLEGSRLSLSKVKNWIVMGETVYIMHDSGKLEEMDKTQLEIPLLEEVEIYWTNG